jgi:quercetin dioxygenase-like cupin family protein
MPQSYRVEKWMSDSTPSASDLARKLREEGYRVFQWSDAPGATYPPHVHTDDQSHWIVSGALELNVTGYGVIQLSTGDRDFMPANTEHAAKVISDEPVTYLIGTK